MYIEPTGVDRNGVHFMLARSKQFRRTIRISNSYGFTEDNKPIPYYYYDYDVILFENGAYIKSPDGYWQEVAEVSLYNCDNYIPDVFFDDLTVKTLHGSTLCKKEGKGTVLFSSYTMPSSDWEALLK